VAGEQRSAVSFSFFLFSLRGRYFSYTPIGMVLGDTVHVSPRSNDLFLVRQGQGADAFVETQKHLNSMRVYVDHRYNDGSFDSVAVRCVRRFGSRRGALASQ
jgi:hypothetical protein